MAPETKLVAKVFARTVLVIAVIIGFLERWYPPSYILTEASNGFPEWVGWLGWAFLALAAVTLLLVEFVEWRGAKK